MYRRIFSLLIILLCMKSSSASSNITCDFTVKDGQYTVRLSNQSHKESERSIKIYGRHMNGYKNMNVTVLDASNKNNHLDLIPPTLLQIFVNVKKLNLENCGLKRLNTVSFRYCKNIKIMKFADDKIQIEAGVFRMCRNLEVLQFLNNQIENIDRHTFKGLESLKVLKMHNNQLSTIEPIVLMPLYNLEEFHFTKNNITELPEMALTKMSSLKVMNFSGNDLTNFSSFILINKNHLKLIDLSSNKIELVERKIFENWPNNAELNIESNACINENFGPIGTSSWPIKDVVEKFTNCFEKSTTKIIDIPKESNLDEAESSEIADQTGFKKGKIEAAKTTVSMKKENDFEKLKNITKDEKNTEDMTDSPFDFATEPVASTTSSNSTKKFANSTAKDVDSSDYDSEELLEALLATTNLTTESTSAKSTTLETSTTKTESSTTTAETSTSKAIKMKKKKKDKKETESTTLKPRATVTSLKEDLTTSKIEIATESTTSELPEDAKNFEPHLHDYEQSACRFYIDADKKYNCVLENVTNELKRINTDHFNGYSSLNVSVVFFRNSKLFHVPKILVETFPNVAVLSIEDTNLKVMDSEFIKVCGNIRKIKLMNNKLRRVESMALKSCKKLEEVDLSGNPVDTIESGIFDCNPKLSLIFNQLRILPAQSDVKKGCF